jgi:hypothetical protein
MNGKPRRRGNSAAPATARIVRLGLVKRRGRDCRRKFKLRCPSSRLIASSCENYHPPAARSASLSDGFWTTTQPATSTRDSRRNGRPVHRIGAGHLRITGAGSEYTRGRKLKETFGRSRTELGPGDAIASNLQTRPDRSVSGPAALYSASSNRVQQRLRLRWASRGSTITAHDLIEQSITCPMRPTQPTQPAGPASI